MIAASITEYIGIHVVLHRFANAQRSVELWTLHTLMAYDEALHLEARMVTASTYILSRHELQVRPLWAAASLTMWTVHANRGPLASN